MPNNIRNLIFPLALLILFTLVVSAQQYATGCEENEAQLAEIMTEIVEQRNGSSVLIIVARLGDGERSLETSRSRLHNAREYLVLRGELQKVSRDSMIVTLGERTSGLGRVEFYLGGKLIGKLLVRKNKNLCVDCCQNHHIKPYRNKGVMW